MQFCSQLNDLEPLRANIDSDNTTFEIFIYHIKSIITVREETFACLSFEVKDIQHHAVINLESLSDARKFAIS